MAVGVIDGHRHGKRDKREEPGSKNQMKQWLLLLLLHIFSVLSLQLNKLRRHKESATDLSNDSPARGHKEVRKSTGHIMVTTRYSNQHGSESR